MALLLEARRTSFEVRREKESYQYEMEQLSKKLERLEFDSLRAILGRVREMRQEVLDRLLALPTTVDADGNETWQAYQLRSYQHELTTALDRFEMTYRADLTTLQQRAAGLAEDQRAALTTLARATGVPPAMISFGPLGLIDDQIAAATLFSSQAIKHVTTTIAASVNREIQAVVFGGQTRWEAVRNIRELLKTEPIPSGKAGASKLGSLTEKAITIERTALISVYGLANQAALSGAVEELPGLKKEWVALPDKRTDPICRNLNGHRAPVNGTFAGGYRMPPVHPRCRCRVTAWLPDWGSEPVNPMVPLEPKKKKESA